MSPQQIIAIALSVLAVGAGGVGAVQMSDTAAQTAPPQWAEDTEGAINVSVDGPVTPGANVTLTATYAGEPVPHAPVEVNGEAVGTTDADGQLDVEIPDAEEFEVEIEAEFEGERTIHLQAPGTETETDESDEGEETPAIELATDGNVTANETVTVTATVLGTPLSGVEVEANGESVGTTAADGTIEVSVPADAEALELEAEYEQEGEYEVEFEDGEEGAESATEGPLQIGVNGAIAPGETVTVTALVNGTAVENATVSVNDERIGQTDANGSIAVSLPEQAEELEIEIETDTQSASLEYETEGSDEIEASEHDEEREEIEDDEEADDDENDSDEDDDEEDDDDDDAEETDA
jgi:hypothetical protein